ncbi:MAG: hypothetical protein PVG14_17630 [Anaerolineales bacterium]|jgi:hypothetical protein
MRIIVGDNSGRKIGEIEGNVEELSWRLNDIGRARITLSTKDPKSKQDHLRYGNRILVLFENGLPNWGGMIDPPRQWANGLVTVTAYSGEYILGTRTTDKGRYFDDATVGYIFERVILEANADEPMGITVGDVWGGGHPPGPDYHFKDLLWIIRESICGRMSTADFAILASESGGKIVFTANLYQRRGQDLPNVVLREGENVNIKALDEQGKIVNSWDMAGEGTGWGEDRLMSHREDQESISAYGLREDSQVYSDVSVKTTLDTHGDNALAESKQPARVWNLEALNEKPSPFSAYDVGDSVTLQTQSYGFGGFNGLVRVIGRSYDPKKGTCGLVVEEV